MKKDAKSSKSNKSQQTAAQQADSAVLVQEASHLADTPLVDVWPVDKTAPDDVKEFLKNFYPNGLVRLHSSFLAYSNGYWKRLHDQSDLQNAIAKFLSSGATVAKVNAMFGVLKLFCVVKESEFKARPNSICFLNGVLDMDTFELLPHSPHHHLQSGRDVDWDVDSKAPVFEQYLRDVFRDDDDQDIKIQFVKEWMGLCLIPETKYEKFVVCVGAGGNGKSVLLKLMPELLGHEYVYSAPIQRLSSKRALAELHGKLLLSSSEINENAVLDDGILKQIVSGDTIEAERKYDHPFTFTPCVRIMLATNHLPKLRDVTHAFFRRLVMIEFNRIFSAEEMDMNLSAKLKAELAGIFVAAVNGLRSLRERGEFVVPTSSVMASEKYREESDVTELFVEDAILSAVGEGKGMRPVALYDLYVKWCKAFGLCSKNRFVFGKQLSHMGYEKTRSNGKDYWCVKMTDSAKEIMAKASARVDDIVPDQSQPESFSAIGTVKPVATQVGQTIPIEELAA
jgi:putative DNA primase/helicase